MCPRCKDAQISDIIIMSEHRPVSNIVHFQCAQSHQDPSTKKQLSYATGCLTSPTTTTTTKENNLTLRPGLKSLDPHQREGWWAVTWLQVDPSLPEKWGMNPVLPADCLLTSEQEQGGPPEVLPSQSPFSFYCVVLVLVTSCCLSRQDQLGGVLPHSVWGGKRSNVPGLWASSLGPRWPLGCGVKQYQLSGSAHWPEHIPHS